MKRENIYEAVLIDVREPKEYKDNGIIGSINIPSSNFSVEQFEDYRDRMINLICNSGNRASKVYSELKDAGFQNVALMEKQIEDLEIKSDTNSHGWSVDRQFRMLLGLLIALFLIGFYYGVTSLLIIPVIISVGLVFTASIDKCYLREGIARMPWNKEKKSRKTEKGFSQILFENQR